MLLTSNRRITLAKNNQLYFIECWRTPVKGVLPTKNRKEIRHFLPIAKARGIRGGITMIFDVLQLSGGIILSLGYIPQITQIIRTKAVKDLNFKTFVSIFIGILFMEVYAINLVVHNTGHMFLVTNSMALVLNGITTFLIIKYNPALT